MSKTNTKTGTFTFARLELIKMQIRIAIRRASGISNASLESINKGLDNRWIRVVNIYGFDNQRICHAKLSIEIDWHEHKIQLSKGKTMVSIDGWKDNTSIEIDESLNVFNKYIKVNNLKTEWSVIYQSHFDRDYINEQLGFTTMSPIQWATNKGVTSITNIPELSEITVGLKIIG